MGKKSFKKGFVPASMPSPHSKGKRTAKEVGFSKGKEILKEKKKKAKRFNEL